MVIMVKRFAGSALVVAAVLGLAPAAWGQWSFGQRPIYGQIPFPLNTNPTIAPGVSLQQYAYNVAILGRAYNNIPPYLLGYNPYGYGSYYGQGYGPTYFQPALYNPVPPVAYGGGYGAAPYYGGGYGTAPSYGGSYGAAPYYGGNAYTGGYTARGVDPLTGQAVGGGSGSSGGYSSGYSPSVGPQAYGQLALNMEQARILREAAEQARLDTRKKLIDTLAYERAHEYTFTDQQADIAKKILERVRKAPTDQEVVSGKSLNLLMADLGKLGASPVRGLAVMLDEDLLKALNVTSPSGGGNLGLLRDRGRFSWPSAFDEQSVATDRAKRDIELQAQELFQQALNAKIDSSTLRDLKSNLRGLEAALSKHVNEMPAQSFLSGRRFLDDFEAAIVALERGDALVNLDYQQQCAKGGRSVLELVEYLQARGLRLAPANPGEERAYHALQAALAAQSLAVQNKVATTAAAK